MSTRDDLIAVIVREARDLESGEEPARAAATIARAAIQLLDLLDPPGLVCARVTHHNGHLTDRYTVD